MLKNIYKRLDTFFLLKMKFAEKSVSVLPLRVAFPVLFPFHVSFAHCFSGSVLEIASLRIRSHLLPNIYIVVKKINLYFVRPSGFKEFPKYICIYILDLYNICIYVY